MNSERLSNPEFDIRINKTFEDEFPSVFAG